MTSEGDDPIVMQLKANAVCPHIKLESDLFKFGDCQVKDKREMTFTVQNKNPSSKVEISFHKVPNFLIAPAHTFLKPNETVKYKISFEPKTIGKIDSILKLFVNRIYEIELRCFGIATSQESGGRKRINSIKDSPTQMGKTQQSVMDFKQRGKAFSVAEKTFIS